MVAELTARVDRAEKSEADLLAALESFLRAPSIGSDCPGSATIVIQEFNRVAARAAIAKARCPY
jgi:hypothetical protein